MNELWISRLKKWGSLAVVFIAIVCISGALPHYLTPPVPQPQQEVKKDSSKTLVPTAPKTANLAIVNEDQGALVSGQRLNLGNQIVPLISNDQDNYKWETVSRSSADSGLKNGDYQAAVYIPSDFTNNVFTYDQANPRTAVVTYQANPKLTAEESAKIQTEFQKVKGTLNRQFSQIYWRVISDQLSYIRSNFSDVLNKDKQYLQAMSDFYKPSSRDMAQLFDAQLNQINELLAQTKQTAGEVNGQQVTLTDTKEQVSQQLDALNKLNDQMDQQIQTLEKTRDLNKQLVDDAISKSQNYLDDLTNAFNSGMENPMNTEVTIEDPLDSNKELTELDFLFDRINSVSSDQFGNISNEYTKSPITPVESLINQIKNISQDNLKITDPNNTDQTDNIYGKVSMLARSAEGLYDDAYSKTDSLFNRINDYYGQVNDYYDQADSFYEQVYKFYHQADSLFAHYNNVRNDAINHVIKDIDSLDRAIKPVENSDEQQWNGESEVLTKIGEIQTDIGGDDGLANKPEIASISQLELSLKKINKSTAYDGESLFINPDPGEKYNEVDLKIYQQLLSNIEENLNGLLTIATNEPVEPVDPQIERPDNPELAEQPKKPDDPKQSIDDLKQSIYEALEKNVDWINQATGQLTSSVDSFGRIRDAAPLADETLSNTKASIQDKYDSAVKQYSKTLDNQNSELEEVENTLTNNVNNVEQQVSVITDPLIVKDPDPTFDDVDHGFALSFKNNTFDQLDTIDEALQSISASQSDILHSSNDVQSTVNGVQSDANQLTGSWGQNINATAQLGSTIARTLGNTGEPGNRNQNAYRQLAAPVSLSGQQAGTPNTAAPDANQDTESADNDTAPVEQPFLTLLAVLIAGILTGFFSYHYRHLSLTVNALISALLALVSSAVIIYYGIAQYGLKGEAAIMWSVFTLGLIAVMAAWIRESYQLSELAGMLIVTAMIVIFTLPLLRNSMDRFAFQNPATDVYIAIAYGPDYLPFYKGLIAIAGLFIPVAATILIRTVINHMREEKAHETETM